MLVSNAGICPFSEFLTMPIETWERTRQVNLDGSFYIIQGITSSLSLQYKFDNAELAVAKQMKQQTPKGGAIVAVSSISALVGGGLQWYVIAVLKHKHY